MKPICTQLQSKKSQILNKEAEPILTRHSKIQENRENNLFKNETEEENNFIQRLDICNSKLPTMEQLDLLNKKQANEVLTQIQNQVLTTIRRKQKEYKKEAQKEL